MPDEQPVVIAHTPAKYQQRKSLPHEVYDKDRGQPLPVDRYNIRGILDACNGSRAALEFALLRYCTDIRNGRVTPIANHDNEGPG